MSSIIFNNQNIINKGQNPGCIFKLTRGSASIVDSSSNIIMTLKSPAYLNLPQMVYESSSIKTIKAEGRCQISKIRLKQAHKQVISNLKESGLRKNHFHSFQDVPSVYFYSLMQYSKIQNVEKGIYMQTEKNNIYFIVEGNICVSMNKQHKLLKLNIGQILVALDNGIRLYSQNYHMKIACVNIFLAKTLLGDLYQSIETLGLKQLQILRSYCARNQRLSLTFYKNKKQLHRKIETSLPKQFVNKIEAKVERFEQYRRARSCFIGRKLRKQEIREQNVKKYLLIMNFNRRKYCKNHKSMNFAIQQQLSTHWNNYSSYTNPTSLDEKSAVQGKQHTQSEIKIKKVIEKQRLIKRTGKRTFEENKMKYINQKKKD